MAGGLVLMGAIGVATIFGESLAVMVAPPATEALARGPIPSSAAQAPAASGRVGSLAGSPSGAAPATTEPVNPGSSSGAPDARAAKNPAGKP